MAWTLTKIGLPNGRPLLFIPGFMGLASDWQPVVAALSKDFCCVILELSGYPNVNIAWPKDTALGESQSRASLHSILNQLNDFGLKNNLNSWTVVGYSMGGRIAANLANSGRLPINALIMESSHFGLVTQAERDIRFVSDQALFNTLKQSWGAAFLKEWYQKPIFAGLLTSKPGLNLIHQRLKISKTDVLGQLMCFSQAFMPYISPKNLLARGINIHLLAGELDKQYCDLLAVTKKTYPEINIKIKSKASHNVHLMYPIWFAKHLRKAHA